jgi:uncharacterized membrane protein YheB (UPF0754 family)
VSQKIAAASIPEIEAAVKKNLSRELRLIELISASIGLIIGLIVMLIIAYLK